MPSCSLSQQRIFTFRLKYPRFNLDSLSYGLTYVNDETGYTDNSNKFPSSSSSSSSSSSCSWSPYRYQSVRACLPFYSVINSSESNIYNNYMKQFQVLHLHFPKLEILNNAFLLYGNGSSNRNSTGFQKKRFTDNDNEGNGNNNNRQYFSLLNLNQIMGKDGRKIDEYLMYVKESGTIMIRSYLGWKTKCALSEPSSYSSTLSTIASVNVLNDDNKEEDTYNYASLSNVSLSKSYFEALIRASRLIGMVITVIIDYKYASYINAEDSEERKSKSNNKIEEDDDDNRLLTGTQTYGEDTKFNVERTPRLVERELVQAEKALLATQDRIDSVGLALEYLYEAQMERKNNEEPNCDRTEHQNSKAPKTNNAVEIPKLKDISKAYSNQSKYFNNEDLDDIDENINKVNENMNVQQKVKQREELLLKKLHEGRKRLEEISSEIVKLENELHEMLVNPHKNNNPHDKQDSPQLQLRNEIPRSRSENDHSGENMVNSITEIIKREDEEDLSTSSYYSRSAVHQRGAWKLLSLCEQTKGAYIKIGQHLSQMDLILPKEYPRILRSLLDKAPQSDINDVKAVLREDLGEEKMIQLFESNNNSFTSTPIASASLAQVHRAKLSNVSDMNMRNNKSGGIDIRSKQGEIPLAIKVQHRGLRETSYGDVKMVSFVVHLIADLFPDFNYRWIADEMAPQLHIELDFVNEGRNAIRATQIFSDSPHYLKEQQSIMSQFGSNKEEEEHVVQANHILRSSSSHYFFSSLLHPQKYKKAIIIPKILWEFSSPRVLTMTFEDGFNITDTAKMKEQHIDPIEVASLLGQAFATQVFRHGFLHCDPHPANLLVRPRQKDGSKLRNLILGKTSVTPELVILDHGLYKDIDKSFRLAYCRLWKSIVFKDIEGIRKNCIELGAGELYHLLAAILTNRSWDDITSSHGKKFNELTDSLKAPSSDSEKAIIRSYAAKYMKEITQILNMVDKQMLLILKMNDCLRHIERQLDSPVPLALYCVLEAITVLYEEEITKIFHEQDETTAIRNTIDSKNDDVDNDYKQKNIIDKSKGITNMGKSAVIKKEKKSLKTTLNLWLQYSKSSIRYLVEYNAIAFYIQYLLMDYRIRSNFHKYNSKIKEYFPKIVISSSMAKSLMQYLQCWLGITLIN